MADNVLNYLIKATWEGGGDTRRAKDDIADVGKTSVTARNGLLELQAGLDIAGQAFQLVGDVATEFYGALKEGAALEVERQKFDALASSIGTVGDALLGDLQEATGGLVSNADLVRASTDLMNLGLVSTADETVRWSKAVSTLNLDMQVLGLTLANNSKARLDSLGLSMETVNTKTDEFIAKGYDMDKAFDLAVLAGLEDKMTLFGDASETTAGKLQIIENKWTNLTDRVKLDIAEAWVPWIDLVSGEFRDTVRQIEQDNIDAAKATDDWTNAKYRTIEGENELIAAAAQTSATVEDFTRKLREAGVQTFDDRTTRAWYDQERAIYEAAGAAEQFNEQMDRMQTAVGGAAEDTSYLAQTTADWGYVQEEAYAGMISSTAALNELRAGQEAARIESEKARLEFENYNATIMGMRDPISNLITAQADLSAAQGEWVTTYADTTGQISDLNQQLAYDLSDEQKRAYEEILGTVEEGSAEWLGAYNALQSDLSDSQRASIVAQVATLQTANGEIINAYTGNAVAAEDAQRRIEEANAAISESYRQTALDVFQTQLASTIQEDGLGAAQSMIAFQEALGLITPEEAAKLEEVAIKTEAIKTATEGLFTTYNSDGVLTRQEMENMAEAVERIDNGTVLMSESIIAAHEEDLPRIIGLKDETANLADELFGAVDESAKLKNNLFELPERVDVDIYIHTHGSVPDIPPGAGGSRPEPRASGGPVGAGQPYLVGEDGPELFVPAGNGRIVPNGQLATGDTINIYIRSTEPRQAADEVNIMLARRARLNKAALVR